jgi:hypothetical protein
MSDPIKDKAKAGQKRTKKSLEDESRRRPKTDLSYLKSSDPVAFNNWSEKKFLDLVLEMIKESPSGTVPWAEVRKDVAYELNISLETAKRYIEKYTARKAPFRTFDGQVFLNPRYEPKQVDEDEPSPDTEPPAEERPVGD